MIDAIREAMGPVLPILMLVLFAGTVFWAFRVRNKAKRDGEAKPPFPLDQ